MAPSNDIDDDFSGAMGIVGAEASDKVHTLSVGGRTYAIGLLWNNIENKSAGAKEAREKAAQPDVEADLFVVRAKSTQYGLGYRSEGHAKSMVSLAGALADGKEGTWIGAFGVDDGFYIVAVNTGDVLAQTDVFIPDSLEARGFVEDLLGSEWEHVYAPADFGIPSSEDVDLVTLVARANKPSLQGTDAVSPFMTYGAIALIGMLLIGGGSYAWNAYQEQQYWAQLEADQLLYEQNNTLQPAVVQRPDMPWVNRPVANQYLAACVTALNRAILTVPGWNTVGLACDGMSVRMALDRAAALGEGGGTINWVRWALDRGGLSDASASPVDNGNRVEVTWPVGAVASQPVDQGTYAISDARRYLQSHLEEAFTAVNFPTATGDMWHNTQGFNFTSPFEPMNFESILGKIPGLTIDSVIVNLSDFTYAISGAFHEELEPSPEQINALQQ